MANKIPKAKFRVGQRCFCIIRDQEFKFKGMVTLISKTYDHVQRRYEYESDETVYCIYENELYKNSKLLRSLYGK